jgi:hypothetical protein
VYPALLITEGRVILPGVIRAEASPGKILVPSRRHAYCPVSREYREGVLVADVQ